MNELDDDKQTVHISIHFTDGNIFNQPLPIEYADMAEEFMNWFRSPGKWATWSWHCIGEQTIHILSHKHIQAVDIEGYIRPEGRGSKRIERVIDWLRVRRMARHLRKEVKKNARNVDLRGDVTAGR